MSKQVNGCNSCFINPDTQSPTKKAGAMTITLIALGAIGLVVATLAILILMNKLPSELSFFSPLGSMGYYGSISLASASGCLIFTGALLSIVFGISACAAKKVSATKMDKNNKVALAFPSDFKLQPYLQFLKENECFIFRQNDTLTISMVDAANDYCIKNQDFQPENTASFFSNGLVQVTWDNLTSRKEQWDACASKLQPGEATFKDGFGALRHFTQAAIGEKLTSEAIYLFNEKINNQELIKDFGYSILTFETIEKRTETFQPQLEFDIEKIPTYFDVNELMQFIGEDEYLYVESDSKIYAVTSQDCTPIEKQNFASYVPKKTDLADIAQIGQKIQQEIDQKKKEVGVLNNNQAAFYRTGFLYKKEKEEEILFDFTRSLAAKNELQKLFLSQGFEIISLKKEPTQNKSTSTSSKRLSSTEEEQNVPDFDSVPSLPKEISETDVKSLLDENTFTLIPQPGNFVSMETVSGKVKAIFSLKSSQADRLFESQEDYLLGTLMIQNQGMHYVAASVLVAKTTTPIENTLSENLQREEVVKDLGEKNEQDFVPDQSASSAVQSTKIKDNLTIPIVTNVPGEIASILQKDECIVVKKNDTIYFITSINNQTFSQRINNDVESFISAMKSDYPTLINEQEMNQRLQDYRDQSAPYFERLNPGEACYLAPCNRFLMKKANGEESRLYKANDKQDAASTDLANQYKILDASEVLKREVAK